MDRNGTRKWWVVALLFWAAALNYGDRTAITAVFPLLRSDLGMSDVALAATGSFFLWSYALASPLAGYLGDRFSRTFLIAGSLFAWSAVTLLTSFAANSPQLLGMRVALGVVEAAYMPAAVALLAAWHGPATRATAMAIHTAGYSAGMVGGGALAGLLGERMGWRSPLVVLGALGLLLSLAASRFFKRLPAHSGGETCAGENASTSLLRAIAIVFGNPTCRLILLQAMLASTAMWVLLTWMPLYFLETFGMGLAEAGFAGTFYSQTGIIVGLLAGGRPSDAVGLKGTEYRILLHCVLYLVAAPLLLVFLWSRELYVIAAASVCFFLIRSLGICNEHPVLTHLLPAGLRGTGIGLSNSLNCLAGGAGVLLAGHARRAWGLPAIFASVAALYVLCSAVLLLAYLSYVRRERWQRLTPVRTLQPR